MATCDLCGKRCSALKMQQLRDSYRTADINDLCDSCSDWAGKLKDRLIMEVPKKMQEGLKERQRELRPTLRTPFLRRIGL